MAGSLSANALTTLAEAQSFVKDQEVATEPILRTFINAASDRIEKYLDRKLIKQDHTEYRDGHRNNRFLFHQWPVNSITTVAIDSTHVFAASSELAATAYDIDYNENGDGIGLVIYDRRFDRGVRNVKLVYNAGYDDPTVSDTAIPNDIRLACLYLTQFYFLRQQNEDITKGSKTKGDETVGLNNDIPAFIQEMLADHKRCECLGDETATRNY